MSAPLSTTQKRYLSQLAERAFNRKPERVDLTAVPICPQSRSEQLRQFRHAQVAAACGKAGLRCCDQNDYKTVEAHFLDLLGRHGAAFNAHVRSTSETRRLVEHKIVTACREFGFQLSYADKICRTQNHGKGLEDVPEKALWHIFYTVRNRGLARKNGGQSPRPKRTQFELN